MVQSTAGSKAENNCGKKEQPSPTDEIHTGAYSAQQVLAETHPPRDHLSPPVQRQSAQNAVIALSNLHNIYTTFTEQCCLTHHSD